MLNAYLYAWLETKTYCRGAQDFITILFHTPKELKWPKKSSNTDIILVTPDNFSPLTTLGEASYGICSLSK